MPLVPYYYSLKSSGIPVPSLQAHFWIGIYRIKEQDILDQASKLILTIKESYQNGTAIHAIEKIYLKRCCKWGIKLQRFCLNYAAPVTSASLPACMPTCIWQEKDGGCRSDLYG
jgi:hypothetical protein